MRQIFIKLLGFFLNTLSLLAPKAAVLRAARIFATPPKPLLRDKEREFLDTARQVTRHLQGFDIMEYHWGAETAPLVVLSYGWGYNAGRWRHFVPQLVEAGYRVIAYDPPGHGYSAKGQVTIPLNAGIVHDIIAAYGPAEVILAHSFGGASSVFALSQLPVSQHPKRMVVMASFSYGPNAFWSFKRALGLSAGLYWNMIRYFERRVGYRIEQFDLAVLAGHYEHIEALIVHAPADDVTPYYEGERYHAFWPGSRLLSPATGGHHLGTAQITHDVLNFAIRGEWPAEAKTNERHLDAKHELVAHFAGL
jgi:pimeloyl-ACP methyl ester carboxylesterase